jgi:hypothetical protein
MDLQRIKTQAELPIGEKLVAAEIIKIDGSVKALTMTFESGKIVKTSIENYSDFTIARQADPKLIDAYRVKASLFEVDMSKCFDSEYDAKQYIRELKEFERIEMDDKITKVKIDEAGKIVHSTADDEIPF